MMQIFLPATGRVAVACVLCFWLAPMFAQEQNTVVPQSLALSDALQTAMSHNQALLQERQNVAIAEANVRQAKLLPNPDLNVSSESYPIFDSNPGAFLNNQELTAVGSQTLETAGKRSKRTTVARQELSATGSDVQDLLRQLKLEVKRRYYSVVLAKSQSDLSRENLKQFDEIIRLNEARFQQGEISGLEINRVRAERLRFQSDLLDADLQLKSAKLALLEVMGNEAFDTNFEVTQALSAPRVAINRESLESAALQTRPDLRAAQLRLERDQSDVLLQKAAAVPDITPTVGYKRDFGANTPVVGISLPLPLFNRNQGGIDKAHAEVEQQRYQVQRTVLSIRREVQEALQTLDTQAEKVQALERDYVPSARSAREIAQESYRLGALDLIALLDSERVYRDTVRSYNQALYDYNAAVFQLEAATGKEF